MYWCLARRQTRGCRACSRTVTFLSHRTLTLFLTLTLTLTLTCP
jgi:hypothetical protein